eukprot:TRINITY_DN905_c0_g1_i2.p1 TRINITY_DN905_c0_g1~~TRINITY_DN905_c0_g1_i2.p1  ORF type:complete len:567 (-),score=156.33 TRINITY_DN905_c0_g1_i2:172-1845(-)
MLNTRKRKRILSSKLIPKDLFSTLANDTILDEKLRINNIHLRQLDEIFEEEDSYDVRSSELNKDLIQNEVGNNEKSRNTPPTTIMESHLIKKQGIPSLLGREEEQKQPQKVKQQKQQHQYELDGFISQNVTFPDGSIVSRTLEDDNTTFNCDHHEKEEYPIREQQQQKQQQQQPQQQQQQEIQRHHEEVEFVSENIVSKTIEDSSTTLNCNHQKKDDDITYNMAKWMQDSIGTDSQNVQTTKSDIVNHFPCNVITDKSKKSDGFLYENHGEDAHNDDDEKMKNQKQQQHYEYKQSLQRQKQQILQSEQHQQDQLLHKHQQYQQGHQQQQQIQQYQQNQQQLQQTRLGIVPSLSRNKCFLNASTSFERNRNIFNKKGQNKPDITIMENNNTGIPSPCESNVLNTAFANKLRQYQQLKGAMNIEAIDARTQKDKKKMGSIQEEGSQANVNGKELVVRKEPSFNTTEIDDGREIRTIENIKLKDLSKMLWFWNQPDKVKICEALYRAVVEKRRTWMTYRRSIQKTRKDIEKNLEMLSILQIRSKRLFGSTVHIFDGLETS